MSRMRYNPESTESDGEGPISAAGSAGGAPAAGAAGGGPGGPLARWSAALGAVALLLPAGGSLQEAPRC
jgi:hypothetical protein